MRKVRKDATAPEVFALVRQFLHRISRVDNARKGQHRIITIDDEGNRCVEFHVNREFENRGTHEVLFDLLQSSEEWHIITKLQPGIKHSRKLIAACWYALRDGMNSLGADQLKNDASTLIFVCFDFSAGWCCHF